ncbi:MAG: hypothetical protein V4607_01995 [Pseudomonadota bacterium]
MSAKRSADAIYAKVMEDGSFVAADDISASHLRRKKIRRHSIVRLVVSQPRDYPKWKKAHELGTYIANNLEDFSKFQLPNNRTDSHGALKHLQALSGVECEESFVKLSTGDNMMIRTPRSLAFDEMEEGQYQAAYSGFCQYLIDKYWHDLTENQIANMASLVGLAA